MPFTLSHPAAVLPLLGRFGSPSALVIGSMIPDLAYYLPIGVSGSQSHGLEALVWFAIPAGLVVWGLFEALVRPFLLVFAPCARRVLSEPVRARPASVTMSLVLGAATHLAWDSFTHSTGLAVRLLPTLQERVPIAPGYAPAVFTLLQHGGGLFGLIAICVWCLALAPETMPREPAPPTGARLTVGALLVVPPFAAALREVLRSTAGEASLDLLRAVLVRAVFSAGGTFIAMLVLTALAWNAYPRTDRTD